MLVVSDTSVLINLATIGESEFLRRLFHTVVAPEAARAEFARLASTEPRFRSATWPEWVEVRRPASIPADLLAKPERRLPAPFVIRHSSFVISPRPTTRRLATMNLALRGIETDFGPENADTFRRDLHPDLRPPTSSQTLPFNVKHLEGDSLWHYGAAPQIPT